jgi:alpha-amylase
MMNSAIRLCLILHNHQPIGNFDSVCEQAYQDSYLPFLNVFERFAELKMALHTSGSLMEWLDRNHPEYVDRLAEHVAAGRIEIVGGAFFEPILTMIPQVDRIGQITAYTHFLEQRLGATISGMWMPERVWEQPLTRDLVDARIRYTLLDDFHFRNAGLQEEQLHGYYVTEDEGRVLNVLPGSERLRYTLPFREPHKTIEYLRQIADQTPDAVIFFGDDGEKFGTWPETKKHVYEDGWLEKMFQAFVENRDWLSVTTPTEAIEEIRPVGKIYIPEGSYREMTEWALPVNRQVEYDDLSHEMQHDPRWDQIVRFVRGGYWRNFKVRYPEANEMYSRMMMVSRRLQQAVSSGGNGELVNRAREELFRGQCNCAYWHGAFGGIYLPHLRNAVYSHLIAADKLLHEAEGRNGSTIEVTAGDFNHDACKELRLANDKVAALLSPAAGGQLYELDVYSICHNLLATITRRPEAYHRKVLAGAHQGDEDVESIHDRIVFKQEGLDEQLRYDFYPRKSLLDHFYDPDVSSAAIARGEADERGDFLLAAYDAKIRRNPDRVQVQMYRTGRVDDLTVKITKGVTLDMYSSLLRIAYLLEGVPQDRPLHFGVELNFAGLPSGVADRYFYQGDRPLGHLGTQLDLTDMTELGMVDEWLGLDVSLSTNSPTHFWTFPIESVSQSEGGFELVHQSVVIMPHWHVIGDSEGRWSVTFDLAIDTSRAESQAESPEMAGAV